MSTELHVDDEHPLALELTSLRTAVDRFQHEAHTASVKLQRHSLDNSLSLERAHFLDRENARLKEEIAALRAHPDISPHPATFQVQELTLALRHISDKLVLTEETLLQRTTELANALSDLAKAKHDAEGAYELASRIRGREEEGKVRERELQRRARAADEERKMADLVVQEYADLVRSLEGRRSSAPSLGVHGNTLSNASSSSATLVDGLAEGKSGLQKLLEEFNRDIEKLEADIIRLHGELADSEARRDAECKRTEHDRVLLARAQTELEKLRMDDKAAAKMVSRYMKFSQSSTDSLQRAMDNLKGRHAATSATLISQIEAFQKSLALDRRQTEKLRDALDELSEDIARETYGRRREVSLRLALLSREESIAEGLRRWSRKARELFDRLSSSETEEVEPAFEKTVVEAEMLLLTLDGEYAASGDSPGSLSRILVAQNAVSSLVRELQTETGKRMDLERRFGQAVIDYPLRSPESAATPPPLPPKNDEQPAFVHPLNGSVGLANEAPESTPASPAPLPRLPPRPITPEGTAESEDDLENVKSLAAPADEVALEALTSTTLDGVETSDKIQEIVLALTPEVTVTSTEWQPSARLSPEPLLVQQNLSSAPHSAIPPDSPLDTSPSTSIIPFPTEQSSGSNILEDSSLVSLEQSTEETPLPIPFLTSTEFVRDRSATPPGLSATASDATSSYTLQRDALFTELTQVRHRYDNLQRSFRDCHLALKELKRTLSDSLHATENSTVLRTAVERLNDFSEDARVELEIRVADEELVVRGFETLLAVPGAIADEEAEQAEVEREIKGFIDGTDKGVTKATQQFTRKLDDLQHDIASIKRSLHELPIPEPPQPSTPKSPPGWSQWTARILSNPHQQTSPPTTFGSVMTTPRLRHSPSLTRQSSMESGGSDPFASLGLRVPMPSYGISQPSQLGTSSRPTPRARTSSAMYMLGLGSRSTSLSVHSTPPKSHRWERNAPAQSEEELGTDTEVETEAEDGSDLQTDVE